MGMYGIILSLLTFLTYTYSTLIPKMSLIMSTQKEDLFVFTGFQDWTTEGIIPQNKLSSIRLKDTRGISFINRNNRQFLIFSDANLKAISLVNLTDSNNTQATIFHIGTSCGVGEIAVDWVSGNCYWVDKGFGWIAMQAIPRDLRIHNSRNPNFKKVVDTYLDVPTGIAVYPEKGYLFWTDTGKIPRIERSSLNGNNRMLLTWQGVIRPTSLCIDYSLDRLYWTDPGRGTVEYSDLYGNGRVILVSSPGSSFHGIDIFQDKLVVSDLSNGSVRLFSNDSGRQVGPSFEIKQTIYTLVVMDNTRQPLDNSQRCDMEGCQQICIERPNSTGADCACEDGYELQDGFQCEAAEQVLQRKILYTDTNKICSVSVNAITSHQYLNPEVDCSIVNSSNNITRFTIDIHNKTFYFTDGHKIYYQRAFSTKGSEEIYSTNREIIDLAYDWIKRSIYWFEWDTNGGACFKKTGPNSTEQEITRTGTKKPITVTFDPYNQRLFWMTEGDFNLYTRGSDGKINISGSSIIKKPTDLEYDWSTDRLFWTDDGFMGSMNSNGTNERKITLNITRKYNCVTVFKDFTIIGYSVPNHPNEAAFTIMQEGELCTQINFQLPNMKRVDEVKVYADTQQVLEIELCEKNNGGCEQICLPGLRTTCNCYVGYTLKDDGKTCSTVFNDQDFILAIDSIDHKAYQISTNNKSINAVSVIRGKPSSLDFDPTSQRIVWIDRAEFSIKHFKLKSAYVTTRMDIITQYSHVAVDVSTGNFYVTLQSQIAVIDPEFDVKTLITGLQNPGKLIVFPKFGQMVWIEGSKIRKAKMDGSGANDFVNGIGTIGDIAFDFEGEGALYWCDRTEDKVVRTTLMQTLRDDIFSRTAEEPNNIYIAGQYLYYTSYINRRAVYRRDKMPGGKGFTVIFDSPIVGGLSSLFVYQNPESANNKYCSVLNGGCCKFCLPQQIGIKCGCADGTPQNGNTCSQDDVECPRSISNANLGTSCLPCYNRYCSFTCNDGFELAVSSSTLKCESHGKWNYSNEVCKKALEPYIIPLAAGGGCLLLVIFIVIITVLYKRQKRPRPKRNDGSQRQRLDRPPVPVPRPLMTPPQVASEDKTIYVDIDSMSPNDGANGQAPTYLDLSESQRECAMLSEKNPYKSKIVYDERPSGTINDGYLTASTTGSFREGLSDLRMSHPEEDDSGYLRSSNDHRYRSSGSSDVSLRYQPWDMMQHQARGNFNLPTTNPLQNRHDERTSRVETQYRY